MGVPDVFEEFRVGQRFEGGPRTVEQADVDGFIALSGDHHPVHTDAAFAQAAGFAQPVMHGPFGIAAFLGWFHTLGVGSSAVIAMLDSNWRYLRPILVGDTLHFSMTITRCRRTAKGDKGVVGRAIALRNQDGALVQEGRTAVLVRAGGGPPCPGQEFFTKAWAELLARRLGDSAAFQGSTATWDGTIGLACGEDEVQLRIFKGRVIEAGGRTPNGPTFSLVADELTWAELLTGPANDLVARQTKGQVSVRGSVSEYLRLTEALVAIVDAARAVFAEVGA